MNVSKRGGSGDAGDLVDAPFLDAAERAEAGWLLARARDPGAPAPSSAIAHDYAELEDLLGTLPVGPSDDSWQDEVLRLASPPVSPSRPRRRGHAYRWAIAGSLLAAAALAVVVLGPRPRGDELEVAIRHGDLARGDSQEAVVGDRLRIRARPGGAGELRVYRAGATLVARCPGGPGCATPADGEHAIEVVLDAPVPYYVILVVGRTGDLPDGSMDTYIDAARAANVRIVTYPPIVVH